MNLSILRRFVCAFLCITVMSTVAAQEVLTAKVYREEGTTGSYFGKLYIPKGGKWKIERVPRAGDQINLYRGHLDGTTLYMRSLDVVRGCYWIDATQTDMVFVVRTVGSGQDVAVVPLTSEEEALFEADDYDELSYFDKAEAKSNRLKYTSTAVSNEALKSEGSPFLGKTLYVMANPRKYGLAFAILNYMGSANSLSANSVYVLGTTSAARLNVVWGDAPETTAISDLTCDKVFDSNVYTLQGFRVAEPQPGTLYIRNGHKFVAK